MKDLTITIGFLVLGFVAFVYIQTHKTEMIETKISDYCTASERQVFDDGSFMVKCEAVNCYINKDKVIKCVSSEKE